VRAGIERLLQDTAADELMVVSSIFDFEARLRSYVILAEVARTMHGGAAAARVA
jgi:hypothetical protein